MNKICICLAHNYPFLDKAFAMSLFKMQHDFYEWVVREKRDDTLSIIIENGYQLDVMRNNVVQKALKLDQTHILMLDTDMTFPDNMIQMMIEDLEDNADQGINAITGIYTWKKPPYLPHIYHTYDPSREVFIPAGVFPLRQLFETDGAGAGCVMVKREVFEKIEPPYFKFEDKIGEDLYFFKKAYGVINMLCDPRILCEHHSIEKIGIDNYICYNKLKRTEEGFEGTSDQMKKIAKEHKKLFEK